MTQIIKILEKIEMWFNNSFGWFFINGRKQNEKFKV